MYIQYNSHLTNYHLEACKDSVLKINDFLGDVLNELYATQFLAFYMQRHIKNIAIFTKILYMKCNTGFLLIISNFIVANTHA